MDKLIFEDADEAYRYYILKVLDSGEPSQSRVGMVRELSGVCFTIRDARRSIILNAERKLHYAYAFMEMMGLFCKGRYVQEMLMWYCPALKKIEMDPDTGLFDGHYGERLANFGQFNFVAEELVLHPETRRAVMTMYNPLFDTKTHNSMDVPCTLALQFRINNGRLDLYGMMRSNDIYLGLPYDLTQFTFLQSLMAAKLGMEVGSYTHYATSLHAYARNADKLLQIMHCRKTSDTRFRTMPSFNYTANRYPALTPEFMQIIHYDRLIRTGALTLPVPENAELHDLYHQIVSPFLAKKGILLP